MKRKWYYLKEGKAFGPVSWKKIIKFYESKRINKNTKIWCDEFSDWVKLFKVLQQKKTDVVGNPPPFPQQETPPPLPNSSSSNDEKIKVGPIQSKQDYIASKALTKISFAVLSLLLMGSLYTFITGGFNNDTKQQVDELTQSTSKEKFKKLLSSTIKTKFNIIKLPSGFYDCAYQEFKKGDDVNFDIGYLMGKQCMPEYTGQIKYSDKGVKALKFFDAVYVNKCTEEISQFKKDVNTSSYCQCLHEQFVKYKVGMEKISDPEFQESILNKKITNYCFSTNEK